MGRTLEAAAEPLSEPTPALMDPCKPTDPPWTTVLTTPACVLMEIWWQLGRSRIGAMLLQTNTRHQAPLLMHHVSVMRFWFCCAPSVHQTPKAFSPPSAEMVLVEARGPAGGGKRRRSGSGSSPLPTEPPAPAPTRNTHTHTHQLFPCNFNTNSNPAVSYLRRGVEPTLQQPWCSEPLSPFVHTNRAPLPLGQSVVFPQHEIRST